MKTFIERPNHDLAFCAEQANQCVRAVKRNQTKALSSARECGMHLLLAKEQCGHGKFGVWLESHFEGNVRQAQKYMRLADKWDEIESNAHSNAHLTIDSALNLIADQENNQRETDFTTHVSDDELAEAQPRKLNGEIVKDWEMDLWCALVRCGQTIDMIRFTYSKYKKGFPAWVGDFYDAAFLLVFLRADEELESYELDRDDRKYLKEERSFYKTCFALFLLAKSEGTLEIALK